MNSSLEQRENFPQKEWEPKVRSGDLVFNYVAGIIRATGQLPKDVRVMLSAWLGVDDEETRRIVKEVLKKYGGVPKGKEMTGKFGDAVFNFVAGRIERAKKGQGELSEAELDLLTPWLDCPRGYGIRDPQGKELSVGEVVSRVIEAGKRVIEEQNKKTVGPPVVPEREKRASPVEYAGSSSRGGGQTEPTKIAFFIREN